jgi:hypothetical protein
MKTFYCIVLTLMAWVAPAFATVSVTTPKNGATVTSPVHYVASATTTTCSKGVASMGIYVNNKLVYVVNATKLDHQLSLATGAQHTVVEEWDHCGGASYTTINLTVTSNTPPAPTASISANPTSISPGGSSTLTVKSTNATGVTVSGSDGSSYTLSSTGGMQSVSPTATTTYTATATGSGPNATATATVTVNQATAPTVTIAANPASINQGAPSTLTVTATQATQVTVTGSDGSSYNLSSTGGTQSVSPTMTTTYTADATGSGGNASANTTVTVTPAGSSNSINHVIFMLQENRLRWPCLYSRRHRRQAEHQQRGR